MDIVDIVIKAVVGAVIVVGVWWMLQPKWTIRVVVDAQGVRQHRGLAKRRVGDVIEFFNNDVRIDNKLVVFARREAGGYLRIWFRGSAEQSVRQRIRNYLIAVL